MAWVIIFAGGCGQRMHSKSVPKQFLTVNGKPILIHTIEKFDHHPLVEGIVLVVIEDWIDRCRELIDEFALKKVKSIVKGGKTGQLSIYNGIKELKRILNDKNEVVLIHDGVRPLINFETITKNIETAEKYGNAITVVNAFETVAVLEENIVTKIIKRENAYICRAPQSFFIDDILNVHNRALEEGITSTTDSATLMLNHGYQLHFVPGPVENIKITTAKDFYMFKSMLDAEELDQIWRN